MLVCAGARGAGCGPLVQRRRLRIGFSMSPDILNLNLPGTPYTSGRVLHGVRVEMAKTKTKTKQTNKNKTNKKKKTSTNF